ncbi:MAG TPA: 50S ribosomal protein L25 [Candidatus Acidoferrales bacterium]|jgi:large subunit ribosomal protein L25|nr:50S ribosomal protein L25 [Candidatus Acidoferrales bacterium]
MDQITVEAKPRDDRGKNAARRLRRQGQVPAVLYGGDGKSLTLAVNAKQLAAILRSQSGHNTIFKVKLPTGDQSAMLKDWQVDPLLGSLLHVDLLRVAMDVRMRVMVPVHTFGEPQGVKLQGGIFEMVTREVEIECLPSDIPGEIRVDISELMIGRQLRAGDLPLEAAKIKLVSDPNRVVAHVVALRAEEEKPAEAAAAEAAAPAEPEVIKKGKKEAEEGEEAAAAPAAEEKEKTKK